MTRDDVIQSPFVSDLIRNKAGRMRRRGGYSRSDQEDLQQELLLRLLEAWPRFDPRQGEEGAFAYAVINRAVAFVLRGRQRQLRADQAIRQVLSERLVHASRAWCDPSRNPRALRAALPRRRSS